MTRTGIAKVLLVSVFAARGTSFIFSKTLMNGMSPMSVLAVRFTTAFLILCLIFCKKIFVYDKASLKGGFIIGVLSTINMIIEMYALKLIASGVCALIENMAIVFVPVFEAILMKVFPQKKTLLCAVLAVTGVGFLSITQNELSGGSLGVFLSICAAVAYAICIMATARVASKGNPVIVGMAQIGTMGILSLIVSLAMGDFGIPQGGEQWNMIMMLVLVCTCFGFTFQPMGQRYVPSETAAVFSVVNPLTASIMGITVADEGISSVKLVGYVLILLSLLLYNYKFKPKK